jgi:hypothetical protein
MGDHVLTLAEWRSILLDEDERARRRDNYARGEFLIGTIIDVLEIAEGCKKGSEEIGEMEFLAAWDTLHQGQGLLDKGVLQLLGLGREDLLEALFDGDPQRSDEGVSIWAEVSGSGTRPSRSMRRLILRPTESRWLDEDIYEQMEQMLGEEPDRNG